MKVFHSFVKFLVDLFLCVLWIYIPLSYNITSTVFWVFDIASLVVIIYWLHFKGGHSLYV